LPVKGVLAVLKSIVSMSKREQMRVFGLFCVVRIDSHGAHNLWMTNVIRKVCSQS